jgi:hypothetical protein
MNMLRFCQKTAAILSISGNSNTRSAIKKIREIRGNEFLRGDYLHCMGCGKFNALIFKKDLSLNAVSIPLRESRNYF